MEETTAVKSNVRSIRPELDAVASREKDIVNYVAQRIADAKDRGVDLKSIVFVMNGDKLDEEGEQQPVSALHYWTDEHKPGIYDLTYAHALLGYEITKYIDGSNMS